MYNVVDDLSLILTQVHDWSSDQQFASLLCMNNLRSGIIYHKQINVVFIQLFGNK